MQEDDDVSVQSKFSTERTRVLLGSSCRGAEEPSAYFVRLLKVCVEVKRRERPSKKTRLTKRTYRPSNSAVLGVCASILLRHKNQQMNVLQRVVSLILHRGHAGKQVMLTRFVQCTFVDATCSFICRIGVSTATKVAPVFVQPANQ